MLKERNEKAFVKLEGAGELTEDLPHAVQEQQERRGLPLLLAVGVSRLCAAMPEWMTRLKEERRYYWKGCILGLDTLKSFFNTILQCEQLCK